MVVGARPIIELIKQYYSTILDTISYSGFMAGVGMKFERALLWTKKIARVFDRALPILFFAG
jgi:hypothetical protein